ncbi:MAG TPA: Crp/Fnr family transcriptional regulator [Hymenobacter sp.]|jgi:CRP-like cAMP-binding protein
MHLVHEYFKRIAPVPPDAWQVLEPLFVLTDLPKGTYFARAGEVAHSVGLLESGLLRAFYSSAMGAEYNKHFFQAPALFGAYASLITGQHSQIQIQALTDSRAWVARYADFEALLPAWPALEHLARRWAELLYVQKEEREIEIVLLGAEQRYQLLRQRHPNLEQLVPQYHIASYLGITPTQLSRVRRALVQPR